MDWSRYSNTAWSSSAVAGRGGFQSFSWDGSNILLPCFVCESFTLFEAFEAATNPAEKSDILRQILTLPNTFLFLLILDLHPRLGVFWFDHRISECLRRLRSSFCFLFVIMRFGDHFRAWRLVRRYGQSCLGSVPAWVVWQYTCYACLLAGLQDFECLRPLDELHHVTSFYTGMSNVPLATSWYRYRRWYRGFTWTNIKPSSSLMVFSCQNWCVRRYRFSLTSYFYGSEFRLYNQLKWSKYPIVYQGFIHPNQVVQKKSSIQRQVGIHPWDAFSGRNPPSRRLEPLRWTMAFLRQSQGAFEWEGFHPSQVKWRWWHDGYHWGGWTVHFFCFFDVYDDLMMFSCITYLLIWTTGIRLWHFSVSMWQSLGQSGGRRARMPNAEISSFFYWNFLGFTGFSISTDGDFNLVLDAPNKKKAPEFWRWIFQDDVEPGEAVAYQLQRLLGCLMLPAASSSYVFWQRLVKRSGMLGMELTAKGKAPPKKALIWKRNLLPILEALL